MYAAPPPINPRVQALISRLRKARGRDVLTCDLFQAVFDKPAPDGVNPQMRLGPYVTSANRIVGPSERVQPGVMKKTYRLAAVDAAAQAAIQNDAG